MKLFDYGRYYIEHTGWVLGQVYTFHIFANDALFVKCVDLTPDYHNRVKNILDDFLAPLGMHKWMIFSFSEINQAQELRGGRILAVDTPRAIF